MRLVLLTLLLAGCGDDQLLGEGKPCITSEECAAGLVCDFGKMPHSCEPSLSVNRDLATPVEDLHVSDMGDAAVQPADLSGVDFTGVDLTPVDLLTPPDLTPAIDLANQD
jgi:hypothetical protein